ncbi:MAG: transcriptional regulator with XRE-family HTH domain [Halieaceae bacterium]|jgi:transcriptional regulator with XRE-family HTH domain
MNNSRKDKVAGSGESSDDTREPAARSLVNALLKRTGKVAGGTLDMAVDVATMSAMFGDSWLRNLLATGASPERLEAMADAGRFLRDARETAGLSIAELAERMELSDDDVLSGVERGEAILPLELMLRAASLLARHDPVPFLIKFLCSYNPTLEAALEQWGFMALPRAYERERRFVNLYRQHDFLRDLSDEAYLRFIEYMDASTGLVVDVMERERVAAGTEKKSTARGGRRRTGAKAAAKSPVVKKKKAVEVGGARPSSAAAPARKPVARKVKPRSPGSGDR